MCCKAVTANLFTVVFPLVEPISTDISKPKSYIGGYLSIIRPTITVTSNSPSIPTSLPTSLFFSSILISKSISHQILFWRWSTVESYVINSSDLCLTRIRTETINCPSSRNCLSVIYSIKGSCVIFWGPSISWKFIVEASKSKSFQ